MKKIILYITIICISGVFGYQIGIEVGIEDYNEVAVQYNDVVKANEKTYADYKDIVVRYKGLRKVALELAVLCPGTNPENEARLKEQLDLAKNDPLLSPVE